MTERFSGFQVTLKNEIREDDAEATLNAIRMIKGVLDVRPIGSKYSPEVIQERRALSEKLSKFAYDLLK